MTHSTRLLRVFPAVVLLAAPLTAQRAGQGMAHLVQPAQGQQAPAQNPLGGLRNLLNR